MYLYPFLESSLLNRVLLDSRHADRRRRAEDGRHGEVVGGVAAAFARAVDRGADRLELTARDDPVDARAVVAAPEVVARAVAAAIRELVDRAVRVGEALVAAAGAGDQRAVRGRVVGG